MGKIKGKIGRPRATDPKIHRYNFKLTEEQQSAWENVIAPLFGRTCAYGWAEDFCGSAPQMDAAIGKVAKPFIRAFINAFGERDPEGDRPGRQGHAAQGHGRDR